MQDIIEIDLSFLIFASYFFFQRNTQIYLNPQHFYDLNSFTTTMWLMNFKNYLIN